MRFLITGANGQVGWELRHRLAAIGDVLAMDRKACDLALPRDLPSIIRQANPDVIVNAAAYMNVDRAEDEEEPATLVNSTAVGVMAEKRGGWARFLFTIPRITFSTVQRTLPHGR